MIAEELDQKIRLVAKGGASLNEKFERFQDETRRETQAMIRFSHVELQQTFRLTSRGSEPERRA